MLSSVIKFLYKPFFINPRLQSELMSQSTVMSLNPKQHPDNIRTSSAVLDLAKDPSGLVMFEIQI